MFFCLSVSVCLSVCLTISARISLSDVTVGLSSANYSVFESDGVANITLELTGDAEREVTVLIETQNGDAIGCHA